MPARSFHRPKMRARIPGRGSRAFSNRWASLSRSAVTSASRASATASLTSVSGVSAYMVRSGSGWSCCMVRSLSGPWSGDGPGLLSAHLSRASASICHAFLLSRIAGRSPDDSARIIELRPHPMRVAACLGERKTRSMAGQWTGPDHSAILFPYG